MQLDADETMQVFAFILGSVFLGALPSCRGGVGELGNRLVDIAHSRTALCLLFVVLVVRTPPFFCERSSLLTVKTLTGMTTDVYPRENCIHGSTCAT
jgi:hypothetical protein